MSDQHAQPNCIPSEPIEQDEPTEYLSGERILCVFPDTWGDLKRGRHQIVERLLDNNEVMLIEAPAMSIISIVRDWKRLPRLWSWLWVRHPRKNLRLYAPLLAFPFLLKSEIMRGLSELLLRINLWVLIKLTGFRPTLLYLSTPCFDGLIDRYGTRRSVYVAHDAWEVYPEGRQLLKYEERTLGKVGLAIYNARPNMERKTALNKHSYYVPHGCPVPDARTLDEAEKPADFPQSGEMFLGYWGFIDKGSVDIDLLDWLANSQPGWTIVLVGSIYERDKDHFQRLRKHRNIVFLGKKPQAERFAYLKNFDIALLCACPSQVELRASQLKFWEYASIGLPIVGIPVEEYIAYDWFYAAHSRDEWEQMIIRAAREDTPERKQQRMRFARNNTWEHRVGRLSQLVKQVLPPCPTNR